MREKSMELMEQGKEESQMRKNGLTHDTLEIPSRGETIDAWIAGVKCPYCGSINHHALGAVSPEDFDGNFRQGCFLALAVYCEPEPVHLFYVLLGEHKGSIWLETVIPAKRPG